MQIFKKVQKSDVVPFVWGGVLLLFYGSIIISSVVHGDFNVTTGSLDSRLPDIALLFQICVGLLLFLSFLHRKFFGVSATAFALTSTILIVYVNIKNASSIGLLSFGVFIGVFLLLGPAMYVLFFAFRPRHAG